MIVGVKGLIEETSIASFIVTLFGIVMLAVVILPVYKVTLLEDELKLHYLFWVKRLKPEEIENIWFGEFSNTQGLSINSVRVKPRNARPIGLNQFREGDAILAANLASWWERNKP